VVTPWCWRLIIQTFENDPNIGVAGPSTSAAGNIQALPLETSACLYLNDNQICEYARRLLDQSTDANVTDLPWISGFALFIRRGIWEQLGGFDQNLPDYGNDVELCRRVLGIGYRAVWVRNSYIHHFASASYGKTIGPNSILARIRIAQDYIHHKYLS
jgi:GT2 family glycosyltransferase